MKKIEPCNLSLLSEGGCDLRKPPSGASMSPWVSVRFDKSGVSLTVGNKSCPSNKNHAVIKDFQFGHSDGLECRITIIDEQGSSFVKFMEDILKDSRCICPGAYTMHVDFGWVIDNCPNGVSVKKNKETYHMMCDHIECNFQGGKFMFQIVGIDIGPQVFAHKMEKTFGADNGKMALTHAIREMFTNCKYPPSVASVKFQKYNDGGSIQPIVFREGGVKGPVDKWEPLGLDKINASLKWISEFITTDDKSLVATFNSEFPGGEIIFWEDFQPGCNETRSWESSCLGTFVVNGGKDSPVIEFSPRIKWDFFSLVSPGGNMGEGKPMINNNGGKMMGRLLCYTIDREAAPTAGGTQSAAVSNASKNLKGDQAGQEVAKAQGQQQKAFRLYHNDIEADLVIVGDPEMMRPSLAIWAKNVKIVFLNPFHIFDGADAGCGEWLAAPHCNEVLSNKGWNVKSITHNISEGKFTTTIQVYLSAPGTVLNIGDPLGGAGSGGWVPPAAC